MVNKIALYSSEIYFLDDELVVYWSTLLSSLEFGVSLEGMVGWIYVPVLLNKELVSSVCVLSAVKKTEDVVTCPPIAWLNRIGGTAMSSCVFNVHTLVGTTWSHRICS